jgi:Asp-tRNA(Asn)/Glu-tRNA(Gln) amidotransferase A subunit family amidase
MTFIFSNEHCGNSLCLVSARQLTCRQLVQTYLDRIENYDKRGPAINAIITVNPMP